MVMTDFEYAAMKVFKNVFPEVSIKGCLFHFGQSLFRRWSQLGLKEAYINDIKVNQWFRTVFLLALIPIDDIDTIWRVHIHASRRPDLPNIQKFLDYFTDTYFEGF